MSSPLQLRFLLSADGVGGLPDVDAEVAVVGRSNVGKSSLINALGGRKAVAKVSKTPGRTRLLNCFAVGERTTLVDCPGYGYAAVPARVRAAWQRMVDEYLLEREPLAMVLVLVDGEIGPTPLDLETLVWLRDHDVPCTVVATKHDKVRAARRDKRKAELAAGCGVAPGEVVWVSAAKGTGIDRLRSLVLGWLEGG